MADNLVFTNNASALLAATISSGDGTIQVASGYGALFPSPTGGQFFYATLEDDAGNIEVVKCTARTGDNLTVTRAQDGTTAQAFTLTVTRVELRLVKVAMQEFLQKNGGTMTGDIDMNNNNIVDAVLSGTGTKITAGEIVNVPLRGLTGASANQIAVPTDGTTRATASGATILCAGDDIVAQLDTAGVINLNSATVGVKIPAGAYFRVEGTSSAEYFQLEHDDTDINITLGNVTEINIPGAINLTGNLKLSENEVQGGTFVDYGVKSQAVTATSTTTLDYSAGSFVKLALNNNISVLAVSNAPTTGVYGFRLKITSLTGTETITWTGLGTVKWAGGVAPTLGAAGEIDYVDIWTDDGGTNWYGVWLLDFS